MNRLLFPVAFFLLVLCETQSARAQQTIFNVPSATVTPKGHVFLQNEGQFRSWTPGAFYVGTQYQAIGLGFNTELDLTVFNLSAPKSGKVVLGTGFKSCIPVLKNKWKERELKLTIGEMIPVSLESGDRVGNWTYITASGRLPKLNTRLTAGLSTGTAHIFSRAHTCFIGGYEQPVNKWFGLQGDWYSGRHSLGLFVPGFYVSFPRDYTLYCGFQIPNTQENGRTGFVVELAKVLPLRVQ
ncbi:MAG: hypothetical protein HY711_04215 [Candidatus Melainabacteria bacterium]|nr:hypothetical protein [Candidatus Melainabacteria bacterium]